MDTPLTEEDYRASRQEFKRRRRGGGVDAHSTCAVCENAVFEETQFVQHWDVCYERGRAVLPQGSFQL